MIEEPNAPESIELSDKTLIVSACAVTRSMREKMSKETDIEHGLDLRNTLADLDRQVESSSQTLGEESSEEKKGKSLSCAGDYEEPVLNRQQLIFNQEKDPELSLLCETALSEDEASKVPVCYFKKSGVLMRSGDPRRPLLMKSGMLFIRL